MTTLRNRKTFDLGVQVKKIWEPNDDKLFKFRKMLQESCSKNNLKIMEEIRRENGVEFTITHIDENTYADIAIYNELKKTHSIDYYRTSNFDSILFNYDERGPEISKPEAFLEMSKIIIAFVTFLFLCYLYVMFFI